MSLHPNGVDTELYLCPLRGASDWNNQWYNFQICIRENESRAEVCCGMIQTEYNQLDATEVDEGKEAEYSIQYFKEQHHLIPRSCNKATDTKCVY